MSVLTYKCPSCGAPLTYDGSKQELTCGSCGNSFTPDVVREVAEIESQDTGFERMEWDIQDGPFSEAEAAHTRAYSCSSCGSQLMTDETTVAWCAFWVAQPSSKYSLSKKPSASHCAALISRKGHAMFMIISQATALPKPVPQNNHIDEIRQLHVPY